MMTKSLLAAASLTIASLLGTAPQAQAGVHIAVGWGQTYVSGHASCGCPIYSRRVCNGYDRYQRPVFATYPQPFHCGCKDYEKRQKEERKYYERQEKERRDYFKRQEKERRDYEKRMEKLHDKYRRH